MTPRSLDCQPRILFFGVTTAVGIWAGGRWLDPTGDAGFSWSRAYRPGRNRLVLLAGEFPTVRYALEVSRELNAHDLLVDRRPAGIRMSPRFYTMDEELNRAFETIEKVRASRAWERWSNRPTVVT